jgi:ribosomal protein S18 acetylase RimI-like enzyme
VSEPPRDFDPVTDDRRAIAHLLYLANPELYGGLPRDTRLDLLAPLVGTRGTDLEQVRVIDVDGGIGGMWCGLFPVAQLTGRQLKLLALLNKQLDRAAWSAFQQHSASYATTVTAPPAQSAYLSRIAVAERARSRGVGRRLVDDFVAAANGAAVSLHVRADNAAAIQLYEQVGFCRRSDGPLLLMVREPSLPNGSG